MDENEIDRKVVNLKEFERVDLAKVAADLGIDFASLPAEIKALMIDSAREGYSSGIYQAS